MKQQPILNIWWSPRKNVSSQSIGVRWSASSPCNPHRPAEVVYLLKIISFSFCAFGYIEKQAPDANQFGNIRFFPFDFPPFRTTKMFSLIFEAWPSRKQKIPTSRKVFFFFSVYWRNTSTWKQRGKFRTIIPIGCVRVFLVNRFLFFFRVGRNQ